MSLGLIALLDDVAALAKVAAATLDDVAGQAAKAGAKSAGVVIDDAAVTPRYVVGFTADRELPIIARIARGSLFNKIVILLPAAMLLSLFAPWVVTPLLMLGGAYLCYEGAEKVFEAVAPAAAHKHEEAVAEVSDPTELEEFRIQSAIRTDFILSTEIMAIALATVADAGFWTQALVLGLVGLFITTGVYGAVAIIVRADDFGLMLARDSRTAFLRALGRGLVAAMPYFLSGLAVIGTAAMIWVGGGIIIHGLAVYGADGIEHWIHDLGAAAGAAMPPVAGAVAWIVGALSSGVAGLMLGLALIPIVARVIAPATRALAGLWRRARRQEA